MSDAIELHQLIEECQKLIDRRFYGSVTFKFKEGKISPVIHIQKTYKVYKEKNSNDI